MEAGIRQLIEEKNWSDTPLGSSDQWPATLKTLVNVMLNSRFPMFLFWGPELISFYNDAFRPSLGQEGKHPHILGKPGHEAWAEIWPQVKPLLDQALAGEPVWREDLLIPFLRNGRIEDIYWTFSYSAIQDETGKTCGIMVICVETTEKFYYTEKLREKENRFRDIVYQAPIGITIFRGEEMRVEMATKNYLTMIGKAEDELVGKRFFDVMPDLRSPVEDLLLSVLRTGEPFYGNEFKVPIKRHGKIEDTYFDFVYYPLRDEKGVVTGVMVVASEVTEQVRAKFQIQESEKKFKQLLMRSPVPMCILRGEDLVIETANHVMIKGIWQKDELSVIGRKLFDVFPELKDQKYAELIQRVFATGEAHSEKEAAGYVHGPNGMMPLFMDYDYTPLLDDSNTIWGVLVTIADVTEKVEARKKVEASEVKLNIVIDASELGTWEVNFKTREIFYSDRYLEIVLGYKPDRKLAHEELIKRIHPDDLAVRDEAYKKALETGVLHYFTRVVWDDGTVRWIEGKGKLFRDSEGNPDRMLGTVDDITDERNQKDVLENKVLERTKELAQKNADLERMNNDLQSFAYISSHDLQEPLRKIQTFTSRIRDKEKLSEQGLDYFQRIQRSAHQMQVLIQDLLAYSRTSRQDHTFEVVELDQLVEEIRSDFYETLAERNGSVEILNSVPLKIITVQFKQVMSNLISNSLKFSKLDVAPRIVIDAAAVKDLSKVKSELHAQVPYVKICFQDNGIGFEPGYNEKIFEVFQRLHAKHEYSGTGIGLAIVKRIVENHEGFIEAHGEVGKGARFDIYLPNM